MDNDISNSSSANLMYSRENYGTVELPISHQLGNNDAFGQPDDRIGVGNELQSRHEVVPETNLQNPAIMGASLVDFLFCNLSTFCTGDDS